MASDALAQEIQEALDWMTTTGEWVAHARRLLIEARKVIIHRNDTGAVLDDIVKERFPTALRFVRRYFGDDNAVRTLRHFKDTAVDPDTMSGILKPEHARASVPDCTVVEGFIVETEVIPARKWYDECVLGKRGLGDRRAAGTRWTGVEDNKVMEMHDAGATALAIANAVFRTESAVGARIVMLKARRKSDRGGNHVSIVPPR